MTVLSDEAKSQLRESLAYALEYLDRLPFHGYQGVFAETLVEILRGIYLLQNGRFLEDSAAVVLRARPDLFGPEDVALAVRIEKNLRNEEDYREICDILTEQGLRGILGAIKNIF